MHLKTMVSGEDDQLIWNANLNTPTTAETEKQTDRKTAQGKRCRLVRIQMVLISFCVFFFINMCVIFSDVCCIRRLIQLWQLQQLLLF